MASEPESDVGTPSHSESAKAIARMYAAAHPAEAILGILAVGTAKIHSVDEGDGYMDVSLTVRVMGADDRIRPTTDIEADADPGDGTTTEP
jgi:hypothetical protein